jgi:hypothetical protein
MLSENLGSFNDLLIFTHVMCWEPAKHFLQKIVVIGLLNHCNDALSLLPCQVSPFELLSREELFGRLKQVVDKDHDTRETKSCQPIDEVTREYHWACVREKMNAYRRIVGGCSRGKPAMYRHGSSVSTSSFRSLGGMLTKVLPIGTLRRVVTGCEVGSVVKIVKIMPADAALKK